jgi:hypothetical protein
MHALRRRGRLLSLALVAVFAVAAIGAALAFAKGNGGPVTLSPVGKKYKVGAKITFRVRDHSKAARQHHVWLVVAAKRKVKHGQLQEPGSKGIGDFAEFTRKKNGLYTYTPPHYTFPSWYMQRPGKYYWQAHHISCTLHGPRNCRIVSKIRSFRVVR